MSTSFSFTCMRCISLCFTFRSGYDVFVAVFGYVYLTAHITVVIFIVICANRKNCAAIITNVVFILVRAFAENFVAKVADVIFILVAAFKGKSFIADIALVIVGIHAGGSLLAQVADMILIHIFAGVSDFSVCIVMQ